MVQVWRRTDNQTVQEHSGSAGTYDDTSSHLGVFGKSLRVFRYSITV